MPRILIGWELGAGSGHAVRLAEIERALRARGHEPVFAVQQIGALKTASEVWQAPLWPGQLTTIARRSATTPATIGDILAVLGLIEDGAIAAMLRAWERIIAATRPDAVAAEFAPALMLAARGRLPLLAMGTGFSLPPSHHARFPSLTGKPAVWDEAMLLDRANGGLAAAGRPRLDHLPAMFAADRAIPAVFRELDPYREWRRDAYGIPSLSGAVTAEGGAGEELFLYLNGQKPLPNAFWQGVAGAGLPTRLYAPRLGDADRAVLENAGMAIEQAPVPVDRIVARSRMVVSHGGLGFTCAMLLGGVPHVLVPFDIEKRMIAASVEEIGLGVRQEFSTIKADIFGALLRRVWNEEPMHQRARAAAPGFRARAARSSGEETADALENLLRV